LVARAESLMVGLAAQAAVAIESARTHEAAHAELTQRRDAEERLKFALESGRLGSWELDVETRPTGLGHLQGQLRPRPRRGLRFADLVASVHPGRPRG
jgi:GAF domain-containing protein